MPEQEQITAKEIMEIYGFSPYEVESFVCRKDAPQAVITKGICHIQHWPRAELLDYINNKRHFDMINAQFLLKRLAYLGVKRQHYG
jgi:hypothetical protein